MVRFVGRRPWVAVARQVVAGQGRRARCAPQSWRQGVARAAIAASSGRKMRPLDNFVKEPLAFADVRDRGSGKADRPAGPALQAYRRSEPIRKGEAPKGELPWARPVKERGAFKLWKWTNEAKKRLPIAFRTAFSPFRGGAECPPGTRLLSWDFSRLTRGSPSRAGVNCPGDRSSSRHRGCH